MDGRFGDAVRESSSNLSLRELLQQPVTELLGVGKDASTAQRDRRPDDFRPRVFGGLREGEFGPWRATSSTRPGKPSPWPTSPLCRSIDCAVSRSQPPQRSRTLSRLRRCGISRSGHRDKSRTNSSASRQGRVSETPRRRPRSFDRPSGNTRPSGSTTTRLSCWG